MRRLLIGLVTGAVLVAATACGSSDSSDSAGSDDKDKASGGTTTVKVGVIPIVDLAPLYLGQKKGFYSERGIKLSLTSAQGGAALVPGVVSGQFDFGFSNMTSLLVAQSKNVPVKAVVNGAASTGQQDGGDFAGLAVKKGSPLKSAKDVEGKKVAANTLNNICDTSTRESVRKDGGDPSKVKFVEMPFDQMPAALEDGQVDAACVVEPTLASIKAKGGTSIASLFADVSPELTVAMFFSSQNYVQKNPETVEKFQAATIESLEYADSHPAEARDIITTYTKIPESLVESLTLPKWPTEPDRRSIERLSELGVQDGLFDEAPDLDKLLP